MGMMTRDEYEEFIKNKFKRIMIDNGMFHEDAERAAQDILKMMVPYLTNIEFK